MLATLLQVQNVEWHSCPAQDFYAATAAVDFLTFLYVVVFYQVRPGGVPPDVMLMQRLSRLVPRSCASTVIRLFWLLNVCGSPLLCLQSIVNSARSLQDISDERVVPLDYLLSLIVLFMFLVLDRVFYTLGSPLGKV